MDNAALIKERVPIGALAERYGAEFNSRGVGRCPFHDDRHPSASVKNGRFHCYVCNLHLDVFDFVQQAEGCDFRAAIERINHMFGLGLDLKTPPPRAELDRLTREKAKRDAERDAYREDYNAHQAAFVGNRELIPKLELAGRYDLVGACMGHMDALEEWFSGNHWR